jgi:MoaA/NifB/PqqE/SkfB family radical SAM enzyme
MSKFLDSVRRLLHVGPRSSSSTGTEGSARLETDQAPDGNPGSDKVYVTLDITNNCNTRCRICYFSLPDFKPRGRFMAPEEFGLVCEKLSGYQGAFSMSCEFEPLMHPRFGEFVPHLGKLRSFDIRMNTNGIGLSHETGKALVGSAMGKLVVSLDAPDKELNRRIRSHGKFDHIVEQMDYLNGLKARLGARTPACHIRMVLLKNNLGLVPEMVRLTHRVGAERLIVRHVLPIPGCTVDGRPLEELSCLLSPEETESVFREAGKVAAELGIAVELPPTRPKPEDDLVKKCDVLRRGFHVYPDLSCYPCVWLTHFPSCGDLHEDSVQSILESASIRDLKHHFADDDLPVDCLRCLKDMQNIGRKELREARARLDVGSGGEAS